MLSEAKTPTIRKAQGTLLAAAVADALGWPREPNSHRVGKPNSAPGNPSSFVEWSRRVGGRFNEYRDLVRTGEYSDDTQLTLCTARSLVCGKKWFRFLTEVELPSFSVYERGAGGATKRSVKEWLSARAPWEARDQEGLKRYYDAGGNGVSMRISPHCIARTDDRDFSGLRRDLILNGISTHGHPRAILGGLCFGFALWLCLRQHDTLEYGGLLKAVTKRSDEWGSFDRDVFPSPWLERANEGLGQDYLSVWHNTTKEVDEKLRHCLDAMDNQSLSIDRDVLEKLGCFGNERGSGTVTSVAAIFLASRYASDPMAGLLEAVLSDGADSDTLGSMTGNLLGAINGPEWLFPLGDGVQDSGYIKRVAVDLAEGKFADTTDSPDVARVTSGAIERFKSELHGLRIGDTVVLPGARSCTVRATVRNEAKSSRLQVSTHLLECSDGQTIYVPVISRPSEQESRVATEGGTEKPKEQLPKARLSGASKLHTVIDPTQVQIRVTVLPEHTFLVEAIKSGAKIGLRLFYNSGELSKCLRDFGVSSPQGLLQDLQAVQEVHIDSVSVTTDKLDAVARWNLESGDITERERERLSKLYFGNLLNSMIFSLRNGRAEHWTWKDTKDGAVLKWRYAGKDFSFVMNLTDLISALIEVDCRKRIEALLESCIEKM